ncbi:MAG: 3-isopropylmalate dehydratase large subunit [Desulfurococcales archaeon]|nr:3-isopropylmalate dehydratase large subunit [Desulfurococcales archaeon]
MAGTLTEVILERRLGRAPERGEIAIVEVDHVYLHDGTLPLALRVLEEAGVPSRPRDPGRVTVFIDHAAPAPSLAAARVHKRVREWARRNGVRLYDAGYGISHQVMVEDAIARPGMVIVGADSHTVTLGAVGALATGVGSTDAALAMVTGKTWLRVPEVLEVRLEGTLPNGTTSKDLALHLASLVGRDGAIYMSMEFTGPGLAGLGVEDRMTVSNMSVEMGAKAAIFPSDEVTRAYYNSLGVEVEELAPKPGAEYDDEASINLSSLEPMISEPPEPSRARPARELEGVEVDQVFLGSCTNGRASDYRMAARILKGRRVKTRCIAVPASRRVYNTLLREGVIQVLSDAGCTIAHGTCGPCIGAHLGLLADEEVAVSTSNRNFPGRMGSPTARIYLASPYTAAAAAATGVITDPRSLL